MAHTTCMVPGCNDRAREQRLCRRHYRERLFGRSVMACVECGNELREPDPLNLRGFCKLACGMALGGDAA